MSNDRELLELAAKAAGPGVWLEHDDRPWNPLTDDGDRYRLAQSCDLVLDWSGGALEVRFWLPRDDALDPPRAFSAKDFPSEGHTICAAAAAIGKEMP